VKIAMIGIKGIPACNGGFETAVDEISRGIVASGHDVTVYNRSGMTKHEGRDYQGVRIVTLPTIKSKNFSTIVHSFFSTLHLLFHPVDVVHYFIAGTTLWAPICRLFGMKVICSVDGMDWQRAKWGRFARWYLRMSERLAVWWCDGLISDSKEIQRYYRDVYQTETSLITYGMREVTSQGRDWLDRFHLDTRDYVLFVGRLVPENNIHHLIRAFEQTKTDKKLVIVGDDPWEREYVRALKGTRDPRIIFTGGVYGEGYVQFQKNAYIFVLPDEVGGTHPALVEAMGFGNCVLVNDTASNLEVVGDAGFSYKGEAGAEDLKNRLEFLLGAPEIVARYRSKAENRAQEKYRWEQVIRAHIALYSQVLNNGRLPSAAPTPKALNWAPTELDNEK
jgi:glycosyltransferase involved in cell wall biosynthesis